MKIYVNLTCGLEAYEELVKRGYDPHYLYMQSSLLERKKFKKFYEGIDADLLMNLALGHYCVIYDFSAKKKMSRALKQGVGFLRYCIDRNWFGRDEILFDKGMETYFRQVYNGFDKKDRKKLKYFRRFVNCEDIRLACVCSRTDHDSDWEYYTKIFTNKNEF